MKKTLALCVISSLLLLACAACAAEPEDAVVEGDVALFSLETDSLIGQLPPTVACFRGDDAQAPYLLVGTFETDGSLAVKTQLNPELEPSGFGTLSTELDLPEFSSEELYGVVTTLYVSGPQTVSAVFPLTQLVSNFGSVNQKWTAGGDGQYLVPVAICADGGEYYLVSLTDGSVFLPEYPLPPELNDKAIGLTKLGDKVPPEHCGIALFTIKAKGGPYTVCLQGFLSL